MGQMRTILFGCVSVSALAFSSLSAPAFAQDSDVDTVPPQQTEDGTRSLNTVLVTARRREESAQNVPISITVLSEDDLLEQSVFNVKDLQSTAPNVYIGQGGASPGALAFGIRGQFQNDVLTTLDPSVGVYVDGIYWARSHGLNANLLDISRIEVLKGPQGTLFGRNTTGGAISISTGDPNYDGISGHAQARLGNYNERDVEFVGNFPLVNDTVALRLAGAFAKHDGYFDNTNFNTELGEENTSSFRAKLRVDPTDKLSVLLSYEYFDLDQAGALSNLEFALPFPAAPEIIAALSTGGCLQGFDPTCPAPFVPGSQTFGQYANDGLYNSALNVDDNQTVNTETISATVTYDLGFADLKYIGAYRSMESDTGRFDYDGTPFTILHPQQFAATDQRTHELQLNGQLSDGRVDYTLGAFYFEEEGVDGNDTIALPMLNPNNPTQTLGDLEGESWAVFAQSSVELTEALSATVGIRYSEDTKSLDLKSRSAGVCSLSVGEPPVRLSPTDDCVVSQSRTDDAVNYLLSLEYDWTSDFMTYVKTSKGYRAGGFNLRGTTPFTYGGFAPEEVIDYELGLKSQMFNNRFRLNAAAFYSDYTDIQRSVLVPNGVGGVATTTINAAAAEIYGMEIEATALLTDELEINASVGITEAEYTEFTSQCPTPYPTTAVVPCVNGTFDRSAEKFERTPPFTAGVGITYSKQFSSGLLTLHSDYYYQDDIYDVGVTQTLTPDYVQYISQKGYGLLNARVQYKFGDSGFSIAAYGKNLTDEEYTVFQLDLASAGLGYFMNNPGAPKTYGVEGRWEF
ncbi:TonB-dependent receptor [Hyphomonas johnsonii]|uniref:TonB-dependent receptor n=1 Tax=Hyphomonas johnsonii TaxID=81031 RepID=UPI00138DF696|nr:TonB-dependent receptor [Hyphomonas johnsonii]